MDAVVHGDEARRAQIHAQSRAVRQREVVQALMATLPAHCLLHRDEDTAPYVNIPAVNQACGSGDRGPLASVAAA